MTFSVWFPATRARPPDIVPPVALWRIHAPTATMRLAGSSPAMLSTMPCRPPRIVAYLFLGIICAAGPVVLLIAIVTGMERALFVRSGISAKGVIVALGPAHPYRPTDRSRFPVFRFTPKDGAGASP